jgi:uncharacterized protein YjbI with pentapeptide repeats
VTTDARAPVVAAGPDVPGDLISVSAVAADEELDAVLLERLDLKGVTAAGARIGESRVTEVDLGEAELSRVTVHDVAWHGGTVANARLDDAQIRRSRFEDVRATGLDLTRCTLDDVVFVDCRLDFALFRAAKLSRVRFEGCRMHDTDFFETRLTSVVFEDCDLRTASWADAFFTRSELRGCDLTGGSSLERLRGVRMPWEDVLRSAGEIALAAGIEIVE